MAAEVKYRPLARGSWVVKRLNRMVCLIMNRRIWHVDSWKWVFRRLATCSGDEKTSA